MLSFGKSKSKKREFRGNRYTKIPSKTNNFNVVTDFTIFEEIGKILVCPKCHNAPKMTITSFEGLQFALQIKCRRCGQLGDLKSSQPISEDGRGAKEINVRSAFAIKQLGHSLRGLEKFCAFMNMPPPISKPTFNSYNKMILTSSESIARESMKAAVEEEVTKTESTDIIVSGDGTWRKMGFNSLQGVGTLIGWKSGKVIDAASRNSTCKVCDQKRASLPPDRFDEWELEHKQNCSKNHSGNAGKMEVDTMREMFMRSDEIYGVRYAKYIGDGDSKTFKSLTDLAPYGDFVIEKKECVGHVQKRLGTRLRNLKKTANLKGGKAKKGERTLTGAYIDTLASYYGKAIRENHDSIDNMKRAIQAVFYHESSTDESPYHCLCPRSTATTITWCKYRRAEERNELNVFRHKPTLPQATWDAIRPVFEKLSESDLLKRCIGGYTQNRNESLNSSIWKFAPKKTYSGFDSLKIAVALATVKFNDGSKSILDISRDLGLQPNRFMIDFAEKEDDARSKARKNNQGTSKRESDDDSNSDYIDPYGPGIAD